MTSAGAILGTENLETEFMDERRRRPPRGGVASVTSLPLSRFAFECKHRHAPHRPDAVHEEHERVRMQVGQDQEVPHAKHAPSYLLAGGLRGRFDADMVAARDERRQGEATAAMQIGGKDAFERLKTRRTVVHLVCPRQMALGAPREMRSAP